MRYHNGSVYHLEPFFEWKNKNGQVNLSGDICPQ